MEVGKAIPVYVITPEDSSGNLILSFIRAVEEQSWVDAEALLKSGEAFDSKIVGYNKGGLIVMLSTIRGFIPASQLSFSRRLGISGDTPEAKYKDLIGEDITVCVIEVDRDRHRSDEPRSRRRHERTARLPGLGPRPQTHRTLNPRA